MDVDMDMDMDMNVTIPSIILRYEEIINDDPNVAEDRISKVIEFIGEKKSKYSHTDYSVIQKPSYVQGR